MNCRCSSYSNNTLVSRITRFAAIALTGTFLLSPQGVQSQVAGSTTTDVSHAPIHDPAIPKKDWVDPATRKARNRRHNNPTGGQIQELPKGLEPDPIITHWANRLPALPVQQSDLIVIATVTDAQALQSEDHHWLYSEFNLGVEQTLKAVDKAGPVPGSSIVSYREGGAYRFPSGRVEVLRIHQQSYPEVGHRYLFFLKNNPETRDYLIVTGYELRNGKVEPLDGKEPRSTEAYPFGRYKGEDERAFIDEVLTAITDGGI